MGGKLILLFLTACFVGYGGPLFLTPLIKQGKINEAQESAKVELKFVPNISSYSGYLTVNEQYNSNLFIWFFQSESDPKNDPFMLWLEGGPGDSDMFGIFINHGPYRIIDNVTVELRQERLTKTHNVLYVDNPVGTGFSMTAKEGLCKNVYEVADELYEALQQFLDLFPNMRKNDFYVAGESYGGKYTIATSHLIHEKNKLSKENGLINLKGLAIGNGWIDPINQIYLADYYFQFGFIDKNTKLDAIQHEEKVKELYKAGNYTDAFDEYYGLMGKLRSASSFTYLYDIVDTNPDYKKPIMEEIANSPDFKTAIHVGKSVYSYGDDVFDAMKGDYMQSVIDLLPNLMENYRVLLYSGQNDMIVPYCTTVNVLEKLNFKSKDDYAKASRKPWFIGSDLAGYVKVAGNLTDILVRGAGHFVPFYQPKRAYELLYNLTRSIPFV